MTARLAHSRVLRTLWAANGARASSGVLVLASALVIAVAALTGVGFLVGRVGAAVDLQAAEVLAADLRLGSPHPSARSTWMKPRGAGCAPLAASPS